MRTIVEMTSCSGRVIRPWWLRSTCRAQQPSRHYLCRTWPTRCWRERSPLRLRSRQEPPPRCCHSPPPPVVCRESLPGRTRTRPPGSVRLCSSPTSVTSGPTAISRTSSTGAFLFCLTVDICSVRAILIAVGTYGCFIRQFCKGRVSVAGNRQLIPL